MPNSSSPLLAGAHNPRMAHILLLEDETLIAQSLSQALRADGHEVWHAATCAQAMHYMQHRLPQMAILDGRLPDGDGLQVLAALRQATPRVSVIMLTARDDLQDRVHGLRSGADDYLAKPFAWMELQARIEALLRRDTAPDTLTRLAAHGVSVDLIGRQARLGQACLDLAAREFDLLAYLLRNAGKVVSRRMLAQDVWQSPARATALDNVIDVHITRLRRKLEAVQPRRLVHTVRGRGFCFALDEPL